MAWVCKYCSTNNEDGESKCMVCDREKKENRVCSLTAARAAALGLTGNITIPAEFNVIGDGAFKNRTDIYSVTLHPEVTKISKEAFRGCTNLNKVVCPVTLTSVGIKAFYNCSSLSVSARPRARYTASDAYGLDSPSFTYTSSSSYSASGSSAYSSSIPSYPYTSGKPKRSVGEVFSGFGKGFKKFFRIALWTSIILLCAAGFIAILLDII